MINATDCYNKYGSPEKESNMILWNVLSACGYIAGSHIPAKIYCNKDMIEPLKDAFWNLYQRGFLSELKTWGGCFNIRVIRQYVKKHAALIKAGKFAEAARLMSLHSWGVAIDLNVEDNPQGKKGKLSAGFVKCFTDAGFNWGGNFKTYRDDMHFQLSKI